MTDVLVLPRLGVTRRLHAVLTTAAGNTMPTGLGAPPRVVDPADQDAARVAQPPYFVLRPLWSTISVDGWGANRHGDARWVYQVDAVATAADQLEWMRDRIMAVVLGKHPSGAWLHELDDPDVVRVMERDLTDDEVADPSGGVFSSMSRFQLSVTRATE